MRSIQPQPAEPRYRLGWLGQDGQGTWTLLLLVAAAAGANDVCENKKYLLLQSPSNGHETTIHHALITLERCCFQTWF